MHQSAAEPLAPRGPRQNVVTSVKRGAQRARVRTPGTFLRASASRYHMRASRGVQSRRPLTSR